MVVAQAVEQPSSTSLSVFPEKVEFAYEVADTPHIVRICVKVCTTK